MNSLENDSRDHNLQQDSDLRGRRDREITLGTTTVLGIFFALAVLCAAFFGVGYSTGRRSAVGAAVSTSGEPIAATSANGLKPSAGSPFSGISGFKSATLDASGAPCPSSSLPAPAALPLPVASRVSVDRPAPQDAGDPYTPVPPRPVRGETPQSSAAPSSPTAPAVPGTGQAMVQIAAVSHPEDAELLLSTLRRRGYSVAIYHEPQDALLHVQVGPFPARKDADAMRQRLLADGFNAIVKEPRQ